MAVTLEHNSTRAQHSFAIRGAHAGAAAGCQNWLARACGLSMRSDPSGWSPRVHPMDGLFLLLRSLSPGRRSTVAVTLEHNGTRAPHSFATHEAHAGAAAGCQIGWLAPEGLVHARIRAVGVARASMDGLFLRIRSLSPGRRCPVASTLEHNGSRAQHSFAVREARTPGQRLAVKLAGSRPRGLSMRADPSGWSPRAHPNGQIVSANSKPLAGPIVHRGKHPVTQWHAGTAFIGNAKHARRSSAAESTWVAPACHIARP